MFHARTAPMPLRERLHSFANAGGRGNTQGLLRHFGQKRIERFGARRQEFVGAPDDERLERIKLER